MRNTLLPISLVALVLAATAVTTAARTQPARTQVVTDQKTGTILFIVGGHEQARIDASGLHVRQDVDYGGVIRDAGQPGYDGRQMKAAHAQ